MPLRTCKLCAEPVLPLQFVLLQADPMLCNLSPLPFDPTEKHLTIGPESPSLASAGSATAVAPRHRSQPGQLGPHGGWRYSGFGVLARS